ncbi:yqaJ domain-containing protein [Trichonephila clavipes]|uniref:YqaJ domain-containing protein n=1 Tax=Trichonephila clavipes TaxID=2585209 RepID=A0A8X6S6Z4_TRICX|nr:yqaJ domain-containing protein [Trichonephila clavipes]
MENHLSKLKVQNIYDLESETRGQASSERWRYERSLRLSSFFKEIACRKKSTPCSKLVMRIVYGRDLCNAAMKYGLANEEIARKQYEREYSTERIFSRDTRIQTDDATPRRSRVRNHELLPTVTSYIFSNRIP